VVKKFQSVSFRLIKLAAVPKAEVLEQPQKINLLAKRDTGGGMDGV
jgi:hypothetical protein